MVDRQKKCGYIAIIGRPNVGKSTLLNRLLGEKLSITSAKPQTTRYQILGVKTHDNVQAIYVDTPGLNQKAKRTINRLMNRAATSVIQDVDVIIFMVDARRWTEEDTAVLKKIQNVKSPVIAVLNKIDLIKDKQRLLPIIDSVSKQLPKAKIFPISVTKDIQVNELEQQIEELLPNNTFLFPEDQLTDKDDAFRIAEIVREKIMRVTSQEIPYDTAVTVENRELKNNILHLDVTIWVERDGQKAIVIGKGGEKLKEIGRQARLDLEKLFETKVFLRLWVKVKSGWSEDKTTLSKLGMT